MLSVCSSFIFWIERENTIMRARLDGSQSQVVFEGTGGFKADELVLANK